MNLMSHGMKAIKESLFKGRGTVNCHMKNRDQFFPTFEPFAGVLGKQKT